MKKKAKVVSLLGKEVEITYLKFLDTSLHVDVDASIDVHFGWEGENYSATFFCYPDDSPTLKSEIVEWQGDMFYVPSLDEAHIEQALEHLLANYQLDNVFQRTQPVNHNEIWLGSQVPSDVRERAAAADPTAVESAQLRARDAVFGALTQLYVFGIASTEEEAIRWLEKTVRSICHEFIEGEEDEISRK